MKRLINLLLIALTITAVAGCAPKLYEPQQNHVSWVNSTYHYQGTVEGFVHARTMYTQYCQSCHPLHMPGEYTVSEWNTIFPKMSLNVSIADSSKQKIYYYILAGAKDAKVKKK